MFNACTACGRSFDDVTSAPMLRDAVWAKLAGPQENLCENCFAARVRARRASGDLERPLRLADLLPCRFNLYHRPHSWFDLFAQVESPAATKAWLDAVDHDDTAATMAWWWLSFCDPDRPTGDRFLGALLIEATGPHDAVARSHRLGLNPGGEVQMFQVPEEYEARIEPAITYRLLNRAECEALEGRYAQLGL